MSKLCASNGLVMYSGVSAPTHGVASVRRRTDWQNIRSYIGLLWPTF